MKNNDEFFTMTNFSVKKDLSDFWISFTDYYSLNLVYIVPQYLNTLIY